MAERVPLPESPSTTFSNFKSNVEQTSNDPSISPSGRNASHLAPVKIESSASSSSPALSNGAKAPDRVIQDEPGVYLSLCSSPVGGNELRRVRFR